MLPYYRPGFLLACACWQFCKGQILSCWAAAALLFTIWSPHHTLKWDFVLIESQTSDSSDIIKIEHPLQRITCSETQRDAGEPSSHINISQHVWWLRDAARLCMCVCAAVCLPAWIYVWIQCLTVSKCVFARSVCKLILRLMLAYLSVRTQRQD